MSVFGRGWEAVAGGFPASAVSRETSDPACLSGKVGFTWNGYLILSFTASCASE
jgi:hypothetical protein